jgi:hypothetical protein
LVVSNAAAAPTLKTGWITFASWMNNGNLPIKTFGTTWKVPPEPKAKDGRTVFLFNSIEPGKQNAIIQPVLQVRLFGVFMNSRC